MPMPARLRSLRHGKGRTSGDLKDLDKLGIDIETSLAVIALASPTVDLRRDCYGRPFRFDKSQ